MLTGTLSWVANGLTALAEGLGSLLGWRRAVAATVLGLVATGALPPIHAVPLLLIAFTGLLWVADGVRSWRGAFGVGWWFGLGHFASGLYWIAHALLVDAARFAWMIPFAVLGLAAGLALFTGAALAVVSLSRARGVARVLVLGLAWTAAEWLRGHLLTGFPWNLTGTVWADLPAMMQLSAAVGVYGLGLMTVILAALPATLADAATAAAGIGGRPLQRWLGVLVGAAVLALIWTGGVLRLADAEDTIVGGVRLRLVQPNVAQSLKWSRDLLESHFNRIVELSQSAPTARITHVIWPETAVPFFLAKDSVHLAAVAAVAPPNGAVITGAPRTTPQPEAVFRAWNSLHAVDHAGRVVATYDKAHLVPFGEYVPLRDVLPLSKIAPGATDFSAGPGPVSLAVPGLPKISPLICYEIIFPGDVVAPDDRPGALLNVTNDAWFGISAGPFQHFAAARFRAVEEGLPLIRAANNGISAVVDPWGRVVVSLGLGRTGFVDSDLPVAIAPTLYARLGDWTLLGFAIVVLLLVPVTWRR